MTKKTQIAIAALFATSALFVACSDKNQTPTKNVIGDGGTGGQESSGGKSNVAGESSSGGATTSSGGSGGTGTLAIAGASNGTAGTAASAGISGTAGKPGTAPCVLSDKGCYDCKQPTLPQQFLNQCPIAGVTCEKFDNTRVPK